MAKLTDGVLVRHPDTDEVVFLPAGSDLPDWADGLVGDHVLEGGDESGGYKSMKVDELKAEIDSRNKDRDEDAQISPEGTKKDDLIAALEADDESGD